MNRNADRRQFPRAEADFTLTLDGAPPDQAPILVRDISRAGVCCLLDQPVPIMTEVAMRLQVPGPDGSTAEVRCQGAVVRCEPHSEPASATSPEAAARFEVAIFFLQMDEADRDIIDDYVQAQLDRRPVGQSA
jgi:hypothetical protein